MDFKDLETQIKANKFCPENIFYFSLNSIESAFTPSTATLPIVVALEHQCLMAASNNNEMDIINTNLSLEYSDTYDGIVRHMDYNRIKTIHAKPSKLTNAVLVLAVEDVARLGIGIGDNRKMVIIPEDTYITYNNDVQYGLYHGIQITMMENGSLDITALNTNNPLKTLDQPIISHRIETIGDLNNTVNKDLLVIDLELYQFKRDYHSFSLTTGTGFSKTLLFNDQFYSARVYTLLDNSWIELDTYFSDSNYNPTANKASAIIRIDGSRLNVEIPQIYINRGLVGTDVRLVIYSTRGDVNYDYKLATPNDFNVSFLDYNPETLRFSTILGGFKTVYAFSGGSTLGGSNIPTVAELKDIIINGGGVENALTEAELNSKLKVLGYNVSKELNYSDYILYVASKRLNEIVINGVGTLVGGGNFDIVINELDDKYGVINNNGNYVITPNAVFKNEGVVSLLDNNEITLFDGLNPGELALVLNNNNYLVTPFYYLLEKLNYGQEVNAFDLDSPKINNRFFVASNPNSIGRINTASFDVIKVGNGYQIKLTAIVNDSFKEADDETFIVQLSIPDTVGGYYGINSTFLERGEDGEYVFVFDIETNYNLSYLETIELTNVIGRLGSVKANLLTDMHVSYVQVKNLPSSDDQHLTKHLNKDILPNNYIVITNELLNVKFGERLTSIHRPTVTYAGTPIYSRYEEDVYALHTEDAYELDEFGYYRFEPNPDYDPTDPESQEVNFYQIATKGDPILDSDGNPVIKHRQGDIILDSVGNPVSVGKYRHDIKTKIILIDYKYKVVGNYLNTIRNEMVSNMHEDILPLTETMLGLSSLEYNVSRGTGMIDVHYDSDTKGALNTNMSFTIDVRVDSVTYADASLRTIITNNIKAVITNYIKGEQFAINKLTSLINATIEENIVSFNVNTINGLTNINNFKLDKVTDTVGIGSRLTVSADGKLALVDDIDVSFILV